MDAFLGMFYLLGTALFYCDDGGHDSLIDLYPVELYPYIKDYFTACKLSVMSFFAVYVIKYYMYNNPV